MELQHGNATLLEERNFHQQQHESLGIKVSEYLNREDGLLMEISSLQARYLEQVVSLRPP